MFKRILCVSCVSGAVILALANCSPQVNLAARDNPANAQRLAAYKKAHAAASPTPSTSPSPVSALNSVPAVKVDAKFTATPEVATTTDADGITTVVLTADVTMGLPVPAISGDLSLPPLELAKQFAPALGGCKLDALNTSYVAQDGGSSYHLVLTGVEASAKATDCQVFVGSIHDSGSLTMQFASVPTKGGANDFVDAVTIDIIK